MSSHISMLDRVLSHMVNVRDARTSDKDTREDANACVARLAGATGLDVSPLRTVGDFPEDPPISDNAYKLFADPCFVEGVPVIDREQEWLRRIGVELCTSDLGTPEEIQRTDGRRVFVQIALMARVWGERVDGRWARFPYLVAWWIGADGQWAAVQAYPCMPESRLFEKRSLSDQELGDCQNALETLIPIAANALWATQLVHSHQIQIVESLPPRHVRRDFASLLPRYEQRRVRLEPNKDIARRVRVLSDRNNAFPIEVRYHFRRGNWAHYADLKVPNRTGGMRALGARTLWRPPTFAGNPAKGFIKKSFELGPEGDSR